MNSKAWFVFLLYSLFSSCSLAQNDPCVEYCRLGCGGEAASSNAGYSPTITKELPGVSCVMNVGVAHPFAEVYGYKVPECGGLVGRRNSLLSRSVDCDSIHLIELNSDQQCYCACNFDIACGEMGMTRDGDRCEACRGCTGGGGTGSCRKQAEVICPPDEYDVYCEDSRSGGVTEFANGCDCTCTKKGPCAIKGESASCHNVFIPAPLGCEEENNFATCTLCGANQSATCTVHPSHCNGNYECLERCSTELIRSVLDTVAGYEIITIAGDFNCSAAGDCLPGQPRICPWFDLINAAGLDVCASAPYRFSLDHCRLDFVLSNFCSCGVDTGEHFFGDLGGIYYDHPTLVFRGGGSFAGRFIGTASSELVTELGTLVDPLSPRYGSACYANGHPAMCVGTGRVEGVMRYERNDECPAYHQRFPPEVMVCERASAEASASSRCEASSNSRIRIRNGEAEIEQQASCSGDCDNTTGWQAIPPRRTIVPSVSNGSILFFEREFALHNLANAFAPRVDSEECRLLMVACQALVEDKLRD